jgi:hypothetical protein
MLSKGDTVARRQRDVNILICHSEGVERLRNLVPDENQYYLYLPTKWNNNLRILYEIKMFYLQ